MIDSNDEERVEEAAEELHRMCLEEEAADKPMLVLANKQDLPKALSTEALAEKMRLRSLTRPWHIQARPQWPRLD